MTDIIFASIVADLEAILVSNGYHTDVMLVEDIIVASEHLSAYAAQAAAQVHWQGFSVSETVDQGVVITDTFSIFATMANTDQVALINFKDDLIKALLSNRGRNNYALTTRVLSGQSVDILTEGKFQEISIAIQVDWIRADD